MASTSESVNMSQTCDIPNTIEATSSDANIATQETVGGTSTSSGLILKRKSMKKRADVWDHFTRVEKEENGNEQCKCNYCGFIYNCDIKNCGTSTLRQHLNLRCKSYPLRKVNSLGDGQAQIIFQSSMINEKGHPEKMGTLAHWKFDQELTRKALARMVIIDELPFRHVESIGFRHFCTIAQPRFQVPSRLTIARDCYSLFVEERLKLKTFLSSNCKRICLTTDTWTSLQRINYMCLTGHFIDNDWRLNKVILNFSPISSHKGEAIGKAIEKCLNAWNIEKVMSITLDNASSNDTIIAYLKRRINNWEGTVLRGEFLHIRCVAHIMNLVVNDALKLVNDSVVRVRNAVRYVRQSPSRLQKFKSCVEEEKIQSKSLLCLDIPTRWNFTYFMLDTAQKFQRAFERFDEQDPFFGSELCEGSGLEKPRDEDWEKVRNLTKLLASFYDLTLRVSGTSYVTSNIYFHEIINVDCLLRDWCKSDNFEFSEMTLKMKQKYDKYWGSLEELNVMIFVAVVLDPRYKLEYVDFGISQIYEHDKALMLTKKVKTTLYSLFEEYKSFNCISSDQPRSSNDALVERSSSNIHHKGQPKSHVKSIMQSRFMQHRAERDSGDTKYELDKYLSEDLEQDFELFDILAWWKVNTPRFSILSQVTRDVLAIPISTVTSESTFSTGGRVLDSFRSSLSPKIVEALICTQDWLRTSSEILNVEEKLDDIEQLDKELSSISSAPNVIDVS